MIREFEISKPRITIGRRPYNDVAIDNLAVSGEHAAIVKIPLVRRTASDHLAMRGGRE